MKKFYQNHLKIFQKVLADLGIAPGEIRLDKTKKYNFNVYVIDIQNGFMSKGECGVLGSDELPTLIISYLDNMIKSAKTMNEKGYQINLKFIFSRDYHHPEHQSFQSEGRPTGFPAHCQYGTFSSMLHHKITDWIKANKEQNIIVLFKAFHPHIESFSALPYTSHYDASKRQGTCYDGYKTEIDSGNKLACGGGVYFPDMSIDDTLSANPFNLTKNDDIKLIGKDTKVEIINENAKITLEHLSQAKQYKPYEGDEEGRFEYSFVTGLAGDYCVRDTLINTINGRVINGHEGESCLIYDLTAYVILPVGDETYHYIMDEKGEYVDEPEPDKKYLIWVTPIKNMIMDYTNTSRNVCMKPALFMTHQDVQKMV
jgi:hypothetical protein